MLHCVNGTPIDWFSKRQATVETATYGSEFVAARFATNQILDLRITLRYLGASVHEVSYLFGDNESVVTSSTIPHSGRGGARHVHGKPGCGSAFGTAFITCLIERYQELRHWIESQRANRRQQLQSFISIESVRKVSAVLVFVERFFRLSLPRYMQCG